MAGGGRGRAPPRRPSAARPASPQASSAPIAAVPRQGAPAAFHASLGKPPVVLSSDAAFPPSRAWPLVPTLPQVKGPRSLPPRPRRPPPQLLARRCLQMAPTSLMGRFPSLPPAPGWAPPSQPVLANSGAPPPRPLLAPGQLCLRPAVLLLRRGPSPFRPATSSAAHPSLPHPLLAALLHFPLRNHPHRSSLQSLLRKPHPLATVPLPFPAHSS